MFELLFKYPASVFSKGKFVLLGPWPRWALLLTILAVALGLGLLLWRKRSRFKPSLQGLRLLTIWGLQSALLALLLLLLWEPAISVTALRPQQNIIAVVLDDSQSMGVTDVGESREAAALKLLNSDLLSKLRSRFQVRLYRLGAGVDRIQNLEKVQPVGPATQIGKGLQQLADEAGTLPIGAVVLLSDGADNSGSPNQQTLGELRRRRLPVHTIGFGRERLENDVELDSLDLPPRSLENARLEARVAFRQNGFGGKRAQLTLTGGGAVLASREVTLRETSEQTETLEFNAGKAGVRNVTAKLRVLPGESSTSNNQLTRVLSVDGTKHRILYVEGEPRWEFKFIRRAMDDDPAVEIVSMLRTTQNKIYRQGVGNTDELADGFPTKPESLFEYDGIILGSVESGFFSPAQNQAIKDFVDRRGGGLLFLGGRWALADGGYNIGPYNELLPVNLPQKKVTFKRDFVAAELTDAGKKSLVCRIEDDPEKSTQHWEVLPYLANYQDPGTAKPGAVVLARVNANGTRLPLLVTENFGRGRTAVFATGGSWRWRMQQPVADTSQEAYWRQLLRWLVSPTPNRIVSSAPVTQLEDDGAIQLRAEVRDRSYLPAANAEVEAHVISPDGSAETVPLRAEPLGPGIYSAQWTAPTPGSYVAQISARQGKEDLGKDTLLFRREDGVAENFHREQNVDFLRRLSEETGGRYYTPKEASRLPQEISYSEAGITGREMKDLWNMPVVFLVILALRSTEWFLRRRWGIV